MEYGLSLGLGMKLEQKLTPQLIQSLKILQANSLELEQIIAEELQINPLLELDEPSDNFDSQEYESSNSNEDFENSSNSDLEFGTKNDSLSEVDWDEYFREKNDLDIHRISDAMGSPEDSFQDTQTYESGIREYLMDQLTDRKLSPLTREVVEYLIDSLDEDGLLKFDDEVPHNLDNELLLEIESAIHKEKDLFEYSPAVRDGFHILWSFDPIGIGARDLQECLLLQFRKKKGSDLARRILEEGFAMLLKVQISAMVRFFEVSSEEINLAIREIGLLDPKPAKAFAPAAAPSIIPDLIVEEDDLGELHIILNDRNMPMLRVSNAYKDIFESKSTSKDDKNFLRKKLDGANFLIKSIESRKNTMLKTMHAIVRRQRSVFEDGLSALKPMILQDIADEIEMHISTVQRVTTGKYVQTRFGVYELKDFFSSSVSQDSGDDASATQIKAAIRSLIENEDSSSPLSDQALADALEKQGTQVARRTVAKYRDAMGILGARLRKKF